MVIIDIINGDSLGLKVDNNITCSIVSELSNHGIPYAIASELCADENYNNSIIIRKKPSILNNERASYSVDNDYVINNELSDKKEISYSFLKEYVSDDAWLNASKDIVNSIIKFNSSKDNRLETSDFRYIVQDGESLYDIASRFNTTPEEIIRRNELVSDEIFPGQILFLEGLPIENKPIQYIVRAGDKLQDIANEYSTTVDDLRKINDLTEDNLKIGQVLLITSSIQTQRPIRYIVKSGDSLYSIARRYNMSVDEIKKLNKLESNFLKVGQQLLLPK